MSEADEIAAMFGDRTAEGAARYHRLARNVEVKPATDEAVERAKQKARSRASFLLDGTLLAGYEIFCVGEVLPLLARIDAEVARAERAEVRAKRSEGAILELIDGMSRLCPDEYRPAFEALRDGVKAVLDGK